MTRSEIRPILPALLLVTLSACAASRPPDIAYDRDVPPLAPPPLAAVAAEPGPIHVPPPWTPSRGGSEDAADPEARVAAAHDAARVEPQRDGYYNAIQVFPWSEGALYQVYVAPGQVTDITLEPGERLTGAGPIAAGDTARWIIGDTTSGAGSSTRVHVLVKPTRPDIETNLILNTDRRTYHLELRSDEDVWMPSVAWAYPQEPRTARPPLLGRPVIPGPERRRHRYALSGNTPPWRPVSVFDDGRLFYVVFPPGIVQGDMPPLFVIGAAGEGEIVNTRVHGNVLIVDRLFGAAELRLGGRDQQRVRIERSDQGPRGLNAGAQGLRRTLAPRAGATAGLQR